MARLKIFAAQMGFYETVVAAPSMKAALEAWGAHQDLFKSGAAKVTTDAKAAEAALAQPGVVLRRAVGSAGDYSAEAGLADLKVPDAPKSKRANGNAKAAAAPKAKPKPDRTALDAAEKALAERRREYEIASKGLEARRKALDEEAGAMRRTFEADAKALEKARASAALAFRRAGG